MEGDGVSGFNTASPYIDGSSSGVHINSDATDGRSFFGLSSDEDTSGEIIGRIGIFNNGSSKTAKRGLIIDGVRGSTDNDVYLEIYTTSDSGGTVKQMRIDTDGGVFMYNLKAGNDQGAAGAGTDELWVDSNDDNTIKLGT